MSATWYATLFESISTGRSKWLPMDLSNRWAVVTNLLGPIAKAEPTRSFEWTVVAGARNSNVAAWTAFLAPESSAVAAGICRIRSMHASIPCNIALSIRRASLAQRSDVPKSVRSLTWSLDSHGTYDIDACVATLPTEARNFRDLWEFAKQQSDRAWNIAELHSFTALQQTTVSRCRSANSP